MVHYLSSSSCAFQRPPPPQSSPQRSCAPARCTPLFLGMHVTSGEVMTSVKRGPGIGQQLADVIGADSLHALAPRGPRSAFATIGIEKWCMTVQSPSFPRLHGPRGRRTFHLLRRPVAPSPFLASSAAPVPPEHPLSDA